MEKGDAVFCFNESMYSNFVTKRNRYEISECKPGEIRIKNDNQKFVWLPDHIFTKNVVPEIQSINIADKIQNELNDCVDVTIKFNNGERHSITFMTTKWLNNLFNEHRNFVTGSGLILLQKINKEVIERTINELDKTNELIELSNKY